MGTVVYEAANGSVANQAPKKKWGISGSTVKLVAIISMFIDHSAAVILGRILTQSGYLEIMQSGDMNGMVNWMTENGTLFTVYMTMRMIGRLGFPIFCFLLVEGFQKTHDVKKYAIRLGIFALASEFAFDLAFNGTLLEFGYQNVFFTLFIGLLVMIGFDWAAKQNWHPVCKVLLSAAIFLVGYELAELLRTDYSGIGIACIMVLYLFRKKKPLQIAAGCIAFCWEITAPLAFIPIGLYNGERGMKLKYFFYLFYPLHLLLLWLISCAMGMGSVYPVR